jgi:NAD(P)-dependent dehydrogenase (short-subunit alcohol dehydrogenase family)
MGKVRNRQLTVFILSASSDIGLALAKRYLNQGCRVLGTYMSSEHLIRGIRDKKDCHLFYCDITSKESVAKLLEDVGGLQYRWDVFISCVSRPQPLTAFFQGNFDSWSESIHVNVIEQLRVLHGLYPLRNKKKVCDVAFFAGGGVNNAVMNFSAYTASKIMLIKMCEYLDAENEDLNIFIVGPGWTRSKGHYKILYDKQVSAEKYQQTLEFLRHHKGTPMQDIFNCIEWLRMQGRKVSGGRNFSVVYDCWKGVHSQNMAEELRKDPNMYKLRRCKNDLFIRKSKKGQ